MLAKVADFYEEEVDNAVDALSSLLEPLIMVVPAPSSAAWSSHCTCRSSSWARSSPAVKPCPGSMPLAEGGFRRAAAGAGRQRLSQLVIPPASAHAG